MHTKKELAIKSGASVAEVEYYTCIGILNPTVVQHREFYSDKDSVRMMILVKGKRLGFSDNEMRNLIEAAQKSDKAILDGKLRSPNDGSGSPFGP